MEKKNFRRFVSSVNAGAVYPENFGALGDGITDDSLALQAAIDSIANAGSGYVSLMGGKVYNLSKPIHIINKSILFDGANATFNLTADAAAVLNINSSKCEIRNLSFVKQKNVKATTAIFVTGLENVFNNISSRDQKFENFFWAQNLKESHFRNIRVDLDVANHTGNIFKLEHCVNNTFSDSMIGYCNKAFYGSSSAHPTFGYKNEGIVIANVIVVYAAAACNFDFVTFLSITNSIFDFCLTYGVYCSNGQDLKISNTWIASDTANNFLAVGTTPNFDDASVMNCTLTKTINNTTANAFGLSGTNSKVIGNVIKNGMDGGTITRGAVIGNSYVGNGAPIIFGGSQTFIEGNLTVNTITVTNETLLKAKGLADNATAGAHGTVPPKVAGFMIVNIAGNDQKIPYFNL